MGLEIWGATVLDSLVGLFYQVMGFVPQAVMAIIIFVIGLIIAVSLAKVIRRLVESLKLTELLKQTKIDKAVEKTGLKFDIAAFCGWLVKWFLIIAFFMAATDILGLVEVSLFLNDVLQYIPNVIVAVLIMIVGIVAGNFLAEAVKKSLKASNNITSSRFLVGLTRWSVFIFSLLASLTQLGVATRLIETLFTAVVAMVSLAGGLAFGLGGRDAAKKVIEEVVRSK